MGVVRDRASIMEEVNLMEVDRVTMK